MTILLSILTSPWLGPWLELVAGCVGAAASLTTLRPAREPESARS